MGTAQSETLRIQNRAEVLIRGAGLTQAGTTQQNTGPRATIWVVSLTTGAAMKGMAANTGRSSTQRRWTVWLPSNPFGPLRTPTAPVGTKKGSQNNPTAMCYALCMFVRQKDKNTRSILAG